MSRILLGVRERGANARFGLDMEEVWGRWLKLSSVRRSSITNERARIAEKPMGQMRETGGAMEITGALRQLETEPSAIEVVTAKYRHFIDISMLFNTGFGTGTARIPRPAAQFPGF
jgi:hypothetical protein